MPDGNDKSLLESGRNERGQFASKQAVQEAAIRLQQQYERAIGKSGEKIKEMNAKYQEQRKIQTDLFASFRKHFSAQEKEFQKSLKTRQKTLEAQAKTQKKQIAAISAQQQKARKAEISEMRKQYQTQTQLLRQQVREYRTMAREKIAAARAGASHGGGIGRLGLGLGIGAGITGLAYGAIAKTKNLVNEQIKAALSLGPDIMQRIRQQSPKGLAENKALKMVGAVAATSPQARLSMDDRMMGVLLDLRGDLKGFDEVADELLADVVKSFGGETDRMRDFFSTAKGQGIGTALGKFVTEKNEEAFNQLRNAIQMKGMKEEGTLDPLLQTAMEVKEAFAELEAELDKVILQLAKQFGPVIADLAKTMAEALSKFDLSNVDLKQLAMIAGGGYLGLKALSFGGGALARGGAGLAGRGAGALVANPVGAGVVAGVVSSLLLDEFGYNFFDKSPQRRAGKYGYGAMSWHMYSQDRQAMQAARGQDFSAAAEARKAAATTEVQKLRAEMDRLRGQIASAPSAWGGGTKDEAQIRSLEWQYDTVRKKYLALRDDQQKAAEETKKKENSLWESVKRGASKAAETVKQYVQQMREREEEDAFTRAQQRVREAEQIKAKAGLAGTETDLARIRYEYAQMSAFGSLGACQATIILVPQRQLFLLFPDSKPVVVISFFLVLFLSL